MSDPLRNFGDLLTPILPGAFFEQHWEKSPLHIERSSKAFYELLLTGPDVESAIASGGLRYPAIQMAKGGRFFAPEAFTRTIRSGDDVFTGVPVLDRVRAEYEAGATISLPGFQRAWQPLSMLASSVEEEFGHPAHANVYITPGNAAGFSLHYDTHEVFVLQIAGSKHWRVHEPVLALPHRSQPFDPHGPACSDPCLEVDLRPGDLLYLPRGFGHATTTTDSFSIHVTLGVTVYTWVELLVDWAQSSRNYRELRRALPLGFTEHGDMRAKLRSQLPRIIAELQRVTDYDSVLDGFLLRARSPDSRTQTNFRADVAVNENQHDDVGATPELEKDIS